MNENTKPTAFAHSSSSYRPLNQDTSSQDYILWLTDKTESQVLNPRLTVSLPPTFFCMQNTKESWAFFKPVFLKPKAHASAAS